MHPLERKASSSRYEAPQQHLLSPKLRACWISIKPQHASRAKQQDGKSARAMFEGRTMASLQTHLPGLGHPFDLPRMTVIIILTRWLHLPSRFSPAASALEWLCLCNCSPRGRTPLPFEAVIVYLPNAGVRTYEKALQIQYMTQIPWLEVHLVGFGPTS